MKALTFKIVVPLTVISFTFITKWWYALPTDAPETTFIGFPFAYIGRGWHTSLSHQVFVTELIADILIYFCFWLLIIFCFDKYVIRLTVKKFLTAALWTASVCCMAFGFLIFSSKDNIYYAMRPYAMEILATGYKLIWQNTSVK